MKIRQIVRSLGVVVVLLAPLLLRPGAAAAFDVVISTQGEFADAYLVNGTAYPPKVVFDAPDPADPTSITGTPPHGGRHLNGKLCFIPRGSGRPNRYLVADDTYREACLDTASPQARCSVTRGKFFIGKDPDGWGVFKLNGKWARRHIHTAWPGFDTTPLGTDPGTPPQGNADPQGCVFDAQGNMYGNDVGTGDPLNMDPSREGALIVFFPGPRRRYDTYCFLDKALKQAGMPAMDESGNIYIAETGAGMLWKYSPPFPSSAADCDNSDHLVTTAPTKTSLPVSATSPTPAALVRKPGMDHWYVSSVLLPGVPGTGGGNIVEYDASFIPVQVIVQNIPPGTLLNPLGLDVGSDGTLYYAELNLNPDTSTGCGRVSQVRFVDGMPQAPEVLGKNLSFPDGITVIDSSQVKVRFDRLAPAPEPSPTSCNGGG